MLLLSAPKGITLKVKEINVDEKTKNRLQNIGIILGCDIVLMQSNFGDIIVRVKDCRVALNKEIAKSIVVEEGQE